MATMSRASLLACHMILEPSWLAHRHRIFAITEIIADSREETQIALSKAARTQPTPRDEAPDELAWPSYHALSGQFSGITEPIGILGLGDIGAQKFTKREDT